MNILITGAGRGIGYQTALSLSANEEHTILAVSRNRHHLEMLKQEAFEINEKSEVIPFEFDLETGTITDLLAEVKLSCGKLDALINNAASIIVKPFAELTEADFSKIFLVNVIRLAELTRQFLPLLERQNMKGDKSHIVNISSMGGFQGAAKFIGLSAYSSSKSALGGLTECLAEELREKHIAVNCLCLGAVQTEMLEEAFPGYQAPVSAAKMGQYIAGFTVNGHKFFNGKILPVSLSTP
jgi:NAD(P)-dependent dehydrogenase (short-subunit alcohol dehydrogenase family)